MQICTFAAMQLGDRNISVWIVYLADLFICLASLWFAFQLRFNFSVPAHELATYPRVFATIIGIKALSFLIFQTHRSIIRFTSTRDAQRIALAVMASALLTALLNPVLYKLQGIYLAPFTIIIIDSIISIFMMISARVLVKALHIELTHARRESYNVLIYGAGETGMMAKRAIERDTGTKYRVVYFLDDAQGKIGKKAQGIKIRSSSELSQIFEQTPIKLVILGSRSIPVARKQQIIDLCLSNNTRVFSVPPVEHWIKGELSFKQIKKINIEDLLEREPIRLDTQTISEQLSGKIILVTGAAGSIGSELVKQILNFKPKQLVLLDQAESSLYELERELHDELRVEQPYEIVVGDIRSRERMERVFNHFRPQLVFHAAAYKHVPLMELNPSEAILTNIKGTKNLADLSATHRVERFVMVSTDKAVKPTNVMGASKRIAEMYVQSLNHISEARFVTTRFGNVLGSNGSAIPIFKKQIERGGPVTVTHPDITRYFMTIPEACQLVLEAGAISQGGEIFIFDMGKSVKIIDLVRKMIKLSGLEAGKDIEIIYSGLRPGEKLFEELLNDQENTLPTHHPQIMRAQVEEHAFEDVRLAVDRLIDTAEQQDNVAMVSGMKAMVPDYKSKNSVFEALDKTHS